MSTPNASGQDGRTPPARGRGGRRVLLWAGAAVFLVLAVVVALGPTIASSLAPGMIEGSINPGIKGRVKVSEASIGWFKGLRAGPVEVFDAAGELAARVEARAPVTVWKVVTGRYWSARRLDLGTIDVRGKLDLKQYADGTTNLDRAMAPRDGAPARPPHPERSGATGRPLPAVKATLKISSLDITVRHETDGFRNPIGLNQLKGEARVDADLGAPDGGTITAAADFKGDVISPGGTGDGGEVALKLDADVKQSGGGKGWMPDAIEKARVKLALANAPIAVVDAVASMGGALVQGVGDRADLHLDIDGNARQLDARVKMESAGLNADSMIAMRDGVLTASADRPSTVSLRSTEFLQNLPQTRDGVARAAERVKLTSAPSVEIALESLRLPLPQGGKDLASLDMRGASVGLRVKVSGMSGRVALPEGTAAGAAGQLPGVTWKPFSVEPVDLAINISDLSRPVSITTGTRATLDGQPAGDLRLTLDADGLLTEQGLIRALQGGSAGFASKADARVQIAGVSTALLEPVIAGALKGLPVILAQDVGPTLDVDLAARADVAAVRDAGSLGKGIDSLPPVVVTGDLKSRNIRANMSAKLDGGVLTTAGDGIGLTVDAAAPLAQRLLRSQPPASAGSGSSGTPPPDIALSGAGKVELSVRDLSIGLKDTSPEALLRAGRGTVNLALSDLNAAVNLAGPGATPPPVRIDRQALTLTLTPGAGPKVALDGRLAHENQPFTIGGELTLAGLNKGLPKGRGPGVLAEVNPTGSVQIKGLPRSVLGLLPATAGYASASGVAADATEMTRAIAAMVRESIGAGTDLTVRLLPAGADTGGGHLAELSLATAAKGVGADASIRIAEKEAELRLLNTFVQLSPANTNPVLAAAMAPAPGSGGAPSAGPPRLGQSTRLVLVVDKPVKIPLKTAADGAVTPDWSGAGVLSARLTSDSDLIVENLVMGGGGKDPQGRNEPVHTASLALRGVSASLSAPLAGVPAEARSRQRASLTLNAVALNHGTGGTPIAKLALDATAAMDGSSPDATIRLSEVSSPALESLLGQPDLIVGALGDSAEATLRVKPQGGAALAIEAEMVSPRVEGMKIALAKDDTHLWLTRPSTITWRPNEAFINRYLLGGETPAAAPHTDPPAPEGNRRRRKNQQPGAAPAMAPSEPAGGLSLEQAQPITVNFERLGVAMGGQPDAAGNPASGPLKPGVFELGLTARAPLLTMNVAPSKPGLPPTKMTIEGLNINASAPKTAPGAAAAGPITLDLGIDRVSGAGAASGRKNTARVQLSNLADARGVLTTDRAVIDADADIAGFPTPIVDNLANQNGLLTELLGPTVTLLARARNLSKGTGAGGRAAAGDLSIEATSQRATARIKGDVRGGQFVQNGPLGIELREIRNELVRALAGSLPNVTSLEKVPPDEPATITAEGLTVPLDQDMRKLNGKVSVSLGVARFQTSGLARFIKELGGKEAGTIGRKIQPFVVQIDKGVASYDKFRLPLGEFSIETTGAVDLVNRQIDVVTWAPLGSLTEEALGLFKTGLPGNIPVFTQATMFPFRTRGPLDNPRTGPDVELFLKGLVGNVTKDPGQLLDRIGDLLKPKGDGK